MEIGRLLEGILSSQPTKRSRLYIYTRIDQRRQTMLTQIRLRQVLLYDPKTGVFTWIKGDRAGDLAGTRHDDRGSLKVSIDNGLHLLHRLAWLWMTGFVPRATVEHGITPVVFNAVGGDLQHTP